MKSKKRSRKLSSGVGEPSSLSPFQFPGAKSWVRPAVLAWLRSLPGRPALFIEPFAGSGAVSLAVAELNLTDRVILVEHNPELAAFWNVIFGKAWPNLRKRIRHFKPTRKSVIRELSRRPSGKAALAFQSLVKNRFNRGGSLLPGTKGLRRGSFKTFWHPAALLSRIAKIQALQPRLQFVAGDGFKVMEEYLFRQQTAFFLDPPLAPNESAGGPRPYRCNDVEPKRLFKVATCAWGDCLLLLSNSPEIRRLAVAHDLEGPETDLSRIRSRSRKELLLAKLADEPVV